MKKLNPLIIIVGIVLIVVLSSGVFKKQGIKEYPSLSTCQNQMEEDGECDYLYDTNNELVMCGSVPCCTHGGQCCEKACVANCVKVTQPMVDCLQRNTGETSVIGYYAFYTDTDETCQQVKDRGSQQYLCLYDIAQVNCPFNQQRCSDGTCKDNCTTNTTTCQTGQQKCSDGVCRTKCETANDCPSGESRCPDNVCRTSCTQGNTCPDGKTAQFYQDIKNGCKTATWVWFVAGIFGFMMIMMMVKKK